MKKTSIIRLLHFRITSFLFFVFLNSCSTTSNSPNFSNQIGFSAKSSLPQKQVFTLKTYNQVIYAGTSDNLYEKAPSENEWQPLGLPGAEIRTFAILSTNEFIAPIYYSDKDSVTIAKTMDKGKTWFSFRNNYGGGNKITPTVMEKLPANPAIIYAGGGGAYVAKTMDTGNHWKVDYGSFQSLGGLFFIKPSNNSIWAGGENAIFQPILIHSKDGGKTWHESNLVSIAGESTIYDLLLKQGNSNHILIVIGYGLLKTTDGGKNWHPAWDLKQFGINTLAHSARDPETVYASGKNQSGTLFFAASPDFGDTWQTVEWQDSPSGLVVNDMVSVMQDGREVLYLGTNKGVYSYRFEQ